MFITFEGIEGVGKTTQLQFAADLLEKAGIPYLKTREPGGTPLGEEIRAILLAHRAEPVVPITELLLMFAARVQHLETVIKPALKKGLWVLCDRFTDASYAYQGGGRSISLETIATLERISLENFKPDHVFLLDAPVAIGFARVQKRGIAQDRFESEKSAFFERIRKGYLARAAIDLKRYSIIDATQALAEVQSQIEKQFKVLFRSAA
jgi:dTMP kinase